MRSFARFNNVIGIDILAILYCTVLRARYMYITNVCTAMFSFGHTHNSLQCRRDALKYRYAGYRIECVNLLALMYCILALYRNACERERLTRF